MRNRSADGTARFQRLLAVSVIALVLGFLVVVQLRSQAALARSLAGQDNTSVALLINDLNKANNQLRQETETLAQRQASLQGALTAGGADTREISRELGVLRVVDGTAPVHGPGLELRIDGPVMDFELQDALNNLRNAGAEAFALNGYRIIANSAIAGRDQALIVDGHRLSSPYVLDVIGDPEQLQMAADLSASSLQTRVQVSIQRKADVAITQVLGSRPLIYAQLGP